MNTPCKIGGSTTTRRRTIKAKILQVVSVLLVFAIGAAADCPNIEGAAFLINSASSVAAEGNLAVLGSYDGFYIVEASDPAAPAVLGFFPTSAKVSAVAMDGSFIYVLLGNNGGDLRVFDIGRPDAPEEVGSLQFAYCCAQGITVHGSQLLVSGYGGPWFIDVSTPETPQLLWSGDYSVVHDASGAANFALLAAGEDGLVVLDISIPSAPTVVGNYPTAGEARNVRVMGQYAIVVDDEALRVIDMAIPSAPTEVGEFDLDVGYASTLVVREQLAYLATPRRLLLVDLCNPVNPEQIGEINTHLDGFAVSLPNVYGFKSGRDLIVFDVSTPSAPSVRETSVNGNARAVELRGGYAYLANKDSSIIDVSPEENMRVISRIDAPGCAVQLSDSLAIVDGGKNLTIIDISDVYNPQTLGSVSHHSYFGGCPIAIKGNFVFRALNDYESSVGSIIVVDFSDPQDPQITTEGVVDDYSTVGAVATFGDHLFVGKGRELVILDITTPSQPIEITRLDLGSGVNGIAADDGILYVAAAGSGLRIIDVSNPANPVEISSLATPGWATSVALDGQFLWIGDNLSVGVVDISDPFAPAMVGATGIPGWAHDIAVNQQRAVVAGGTGYFTLRGCRDITGELFLPGVAHLPGLNGTQWRSDVEACNLSEGSVSYEMAFLQRDYSNPSPPARSFDLAPGACRRHKDIVLSDFGREAAGALRILTSSEKVLFSSRTYNETNNGSFGSFKLARSSTWAARPGEDVRLIHLAESANPMQGFRTNISLLNISDLAVDVEIDLFSNNTQFLGTVPVHLRPSEYRQVTRVFKKVLQSEVSAGYATVRISTPGGLVLAEASLVSNQSGDGVNIPSLQAPEESIAFLMGIAHTPGYNNTHWRSSSDVCSFTTESRTCDLAFFGAGRNNPTPEVVTIDLEPGSCTRFDDILGSLFSAEQTSGTVQMTTSGPGIAFVGRTYNNAEDGPRSSFKIGVPQSGVVAFDEHGFLTHLSHNQDASRGFRTNISLVNVTGSAITVGVDLFAADATSLGSLSFLLGPYQHIQKNKIFESVTEGDIEDGYARLWTVTPGGEFLASASVVDNVSGDGYSIPVQVFVRD